MAPMGFAPAGGFRVVLVWVCWLGSAGEGRAGWFEGLELSGRVVGVCLVGTGFVGRGL